MSDALPDLMGSEVRRTLVCRGGALDGVLSLTDAARALDARADG